MNDRIRDAAIGLTAICAVVAMIILLVLFGEIDTQRTWILTLRSTETGGITENSSVRLNGVKIGRIEGVEAKPEDVWPVHIRVGIDKGINIPAEVLPLTSISLLKGSADLYLETPPSPQSMMLPTDGSAVIEGPIRSRAIRDVVDAIEANLRPTLKTIDDFGAAWAPVGRGMAALISPPEEAGPDAGIPGLLATARATVDAARQWLEDPSLYQYAQDIMTRGIASLDRVIVAMGRFQDLISTVDETTTDVGAELAASGRALAESLHRASAIMLQIEQGEGTAGQMLVNPDLYNSLQSSAAQFERLAESMRLMVEQIREEGVGPLLSP